MDVESCILLSSSDYEETYKESSLCKKSSLICCRFLRPLLGELLQLKFEPALPRGQVRPKFSFFLGIILVLLRGKCNIIHSLSCIYTSCCVWLILSSKCTDVGA